MSEQLGSPRRDNHEFDVTAAGQVYEVRRAGSGDEATLALVRQLPGGGLLTLSNGGSGNGATLDELTAVAASLREQPKR